MTDLSVEARLDLDLPLEVELLRVALTPLVPLLEDLTEPDRVDLDELLSKHQSFDISHGVIHARSQLQAHDSLAAC